MYYITYPSELGEIWYFKFRRGRLGQLIRILGQFASQADSGFTWYDAAIVIAEARLLTNQ